MRFIHLTAAPLSALLLASAWPAVAGTSVASSDAVGMAAQFTSGGVTTGLGPVGHLAGSAPPGYDDAATVSAFSGSVAITPSIKPTPTLFVRTASIKVHVAGAIGVDNLSADSDSSVGKARLMLALDPPPPTPVPQPFLTVKANFVKSAASASDILPDSRSVAGAARIASLTIGGSLIGDPPLVFSGTPRPNTILFSSSAITVTLNQQAVASVDECAPTFCKVVPVGITTKAIDIALTNANLNGQVVSGDIVIGGDEADIPLSGAVD